MPLHLRLLTHLLALLTVIFLGVYTKLVCPFIDDVPFTRLLAGLLWVTCIHLALRELLLRHAHRFPGGSPPRRAFVASVSSWIIAGLVAFAVHHLRYPDFPVASHLKLMTGYWGLGAGLLAQLDYVLYERHYRGHGSTSANRSERLPFRLMEGFAVFTITPAFIMALLVIRYIYEDLIQPGVAGEILFLSGYFVAIALSVAWLWGRTLREDTEYIIRGLGEIEKGRFELEMATRRGDELGLVTESINRMSHGLREREQIREGFGRFASREVAERYIQEHLADGKQPELGGERREVAVLMCDIRNFTPLSESLTPEQLTELLNHYFTEMVAAIRKHHGRVDKFMGDAVMATFGHFDSERDHAEDAIQAALEMREHLKRFNESAQSLGRPILENGIGIHCGEAVAGYFGSPDRMEFTVIGPTVNIAARIEACCKPPHPPILFSEAVAVKLSQQRGSRLVGAFELKGVSQPVKLYTIEEHQSSSLLPQGNAVQGDAGTTV